MSTITATRPEEAARLPDAWVMSVTDEMHDRGKARC